MSYGYKFIIFNFFLIYILKHNFISFNEVDVNRTLVDTPLFNENFSNLNITEKFKRKFDAEMYERNRTEYFIKQRIKFLRRYKITYDESDLTTFQQKLNYLIIHESPMYKSFLADKIRVHEYSKIVLGFDLCVPIIKIYDDIDEINFDELPDKFVMKYNHGSDMNIICNDKSKLNISDVYRKLEKWKNRDFGQINKEFQYYYIKKRILVEEFLGDNLIDYKVFCFNGEPKFIRVRKILNDENHTKIHNHYNTNWELTDLESGKEGYIRDPNVKIKRPKHLKLMLKYSKLLSQEFVFLRVDLYEVNNRIYLGELTFSPSSAIISWKNEEQNIRVANLIDLSKIKSYLFNK